MYFENESTIEFDVHHRYTSESKLIDMNKGKMKIFNSTDQINAVANRAAGKGYENEGYYSSIQFKFCPIENIHIMRDSLQKLLEGKM